MSERGLKEADDCGRRGEFNERDLNKRHDNDPSDFKQILDECNALNVSLRHAQTMLG